MQFLMRDHVGFSRVVFLVHTGCINRKVQKEISFTPELSFKVIIILLSLPVLQ